MDSRLHVTGGGNSLSFYNLLLDGQNKAGARPLVIEQTASGSNTSSIHFFGGDWGHPGAGQFLVELNGHAFTGFGQITLSGLYMESNSTDNSTAIIQATDVGQLTLSSVRIVRLSGSSTATGLSLTQGGSNLLYGITATGLRVAGGNGGSSNAITNNQNGSFTIPQASNVVPFYAYQSSDGGEISQLGPMVVNPDGSINLKNTAAPPGAGTASQEKCYYDTTAQARKCSYNNGTFFQIPQVLTATSAAFATATTAGTCVQNTTAVTNAATSMAVSISPVSTPGVGAVWSGFVSSAGNVTINECAVATSAGGTIAFNIRVTP